MNYICLLSQHFGCFYKTKNFKVTTGCPASAGVVTEGPQFVEPCKAHPLLGTPNVKLFSSAACSMHDDSSCGPEEAASSYRNILGRANSGQRGQKGGALNSLGGAAHATDSNYSKLQNLVIELLCSFLDYRLFSPRRWPAVFATRLKSLLSRFSPISPLAKLSER